MAGAGAEDGGERTSENEMEENKPQAAGTAVKDWSCVHLRDPLLQNGARLCSVSALPPAAWLALPGNHPSPCPLSATSFASSLLCSHPLSLLKHYDSPFAPRGLLSRDLKIIHCQLSWQPPRDLLEPLLPLDFSDVAQQVPPSSTCAVLPWVTPFGLSWPSANPDFSVLSQGDVAWYLVLSLCIFFSIPFFKEPCVTHLFLEASRI